MAKKNEKKTNRSLVGGANGLADLSNGKLRVLATDIRADILSSTLAFGGHLSSNLGAVELTMSLLRSFDPLKDDILFDIGHQSYAYKILTGRPLQKLRKFGGEPPFGDRFLSPYEKYENGHAGTAVPVAYGMAKAKALAGDDSYTVALIGDSSILNGVSAETLNVLSSDKKTRFVIVLNDNGMGISPTVGGLNKKFVKLRNSRFYFRTANGFGKLMSRRKWSWKIFLKLRDWKDSIRAKLIEPTVFEAAGIKYMGPFDGHDFSSLDMAFEKAKAFQGPVVIHVLTKKGCGYGPAEEDECGEYHNVVPHFDKNAQIRKEIHSFTDLKSSFAFGRMAKDDRLVFLTPAMERGSGLEALSARYPDRVLDVGIAEEACVTIASGFALKGFHPVIDIYSTFLQRSFDEVLEDLSREKVNVLIIDEKAGLANGDGSSHHGIYDVAMMKAIPFVHIYMPFDSKSTKELSKMVSLFDMGLSVLRLPRDNPFEEGLPYSLSSSFALFSFGKRNTRIVLSVGPLGKRLVSCSLKEFDKVLLLDLLPKDDILSSLSLLSYSEIYFYDPYSVRTGTSEVLESYLGRNGYGGKFVSYSFPVDFVPFGDRDSLLCLNHLDIEGVYQDILEKSRPADREEKEEQ